MDWEARILRLIRFVPIHYTIDMTTHWTDVLGRGSRSQLNQHYCGGQDERGRSERRLLSGVVADANATG